MILVLRLKQYAFECVGSWTKKNMQLFGGWEASMRRVWLARN